MASPRSTLSDGKRKLYMPALPVKTDRGGSLEYLHLVSLFEIRDLQHVFSEDL